MDIKIKRAIYDTVPYFTLYLNSRAIFMTADYALWKHLQLPEKDGEHTLEVTVKVKEV
jgi:hypothetical protein